MVTNNIGDDKRKTTYRYGLANASSRIFSKFFDLIFVFLILIGIFFLIFHNDTITKVDDSYQSTIPSWKIFLFSLVTFVFFFIYFVIQPFFWGGYTLFSKAFKIRIYSIYLKTVVHSKWIKNLDFRFMKQLFIRELFLWEISAFIFLLLGIFAFIFEKDASNFINALINPNNVTKPTGINVVTVLFSALFSVSSLITLFIIINVILTSKKRSFHDSISNTVVIKMTDVHSDEKRPTFNIKNKNNIQYGFPGEVPVDALLDNVEEL